MNQANTVTRQSEATLNDMQKLGVIAAESNSSCGLDKNIHGVYTLGAYYKTGQVCRCGIYVQATRDTAEEIRALAKKLGFKKIIDRIQE